MFQKIDRKIEGQPDETYAQVTTVDDKTEVDTGLTPGQTYRYRLQQTVGNTLYALVTLSNNANVAPVANAGTDAVITLPTNSYQLNGSGTDSDGTIVSYAWTIISQPNGASAALNDASITNPSASNLTVAGMYVFRLTVTDNNGATHYDQVTITVNPANNIVPVANAGSDQTITLPTNSVTLTGSATDADGTIASYTWTKQSGSGVITTPNAASTTITGLTQGVSVFRLTVTDNSGATHFDEVTITVNAQPPAAAGVIAMNDEINIYTFTPPVGESTDPADYEAEITLT